MMRDIVRGRASVRRGRRAHAGTTGSAARTRVGDREIEATHERAPADALCVEEIADILDVSLGTVKSRITRGRESMRRQLEGRLEPEQELQWDPATG